MKPGQVLPLMGAGVFQQKVPIWHRVLFDGIYGLCQVVPNQSLLASRKVGTPMLLESRGLRHPVLSWTTHPAELSCIEQLLWAWEERTEDQEPWRTSLSSSFPAFVGSKYRQTWAALPSTHESTFSQHCPPWKALTHFFPQELPCITQCQAEHDAGLHEMQCWAVSRSEQAPATPAQSMASRPLLSAPTCPNRS